eukprot:RCo047099
MMMASAMPEDSSAGSSEEDSSSAVEFQHHLSVSYDTAISLVSGAVAGIVSRTLTAPMDRLKTVMQAGLGVPLRPPRLSKAEYKLRYGGGCWRACRHIYREGGWRGFFRGNGTNLVKVIPDEALRYTVKRRITEAITGDPDRATLAQHITAGALSGAVSQAIVYPLETTKTRMTVASGGEYRGILDCMRQTVRHGGLRGFYVGFVPNLAGIIPFQGTYFGFFFFLTGRYEERHEGRKPDPRTQLMYSVAVSTVAVLFSYPFNLVRTKLQMQGVNGRPILYRGMLDCIRLTLRYEGARGLYRGLVPNYFKALPSLSISLVLVKTVNDILQRTLQ